MTRWRTRGGSAPSEGKPCRGGILHGGGLSARMVRVRAHRTSIPEGSWRTTMRSKSDLLGVDADLIRRKGAVSQDVAMAMARGARGGSMRRWGGDHRHRRAHGGTPEKPTGTVFLAVATPHSKPQKVHFFWGSDPDPNLERGFFPRSDTEGPG